jgi:hypothetical protein
MYELLYKYLLLNYKLGLPGVGSFYIEPVSAKIDLVEGVLTAPQKVVNFDNGKIIPDKAFYEYLSKEMKIGEVDAIQQLNEFALQLKQIALTEGIQLPGIGKLDSSSSGDLSFSPESICQDLLPEIHLNNSVAANAKLIDIYDSGETRIIFQNADQPEKEKISVQTQEDYWWVYAIVLALMGLGALLYYYI